MNARDRFEQTAKSVKRLNEIKLLLMYECDDWKPPSVRASNETSDPTANKAIYNVDELGEKLEALRKEESELEEFIGLSIGIIIAVGAGLGEKYANVLEWCYIDGLTLGQISKESGINRTYCYQLVDVAFDWIDSVGISRLIRGENEL